MGWVANHMRARKQLFRYAVVGIASNVGVYLLYLLATSLGLEPKVAMTLLFGIGVLQTFLFNRKWTFGHQGAHGLVFVRYCLSYGTGYLVNLLALILLVDLAGIPHQLVQGFMILVVAALLFLAQKYWVFSEQSGVDLA